MEIESENNIDGENWFEEKKLPRITEQRRATQTGCISDQKWKNCHPSCQKHSTGTSSTSSKRQQKDANYSCQGFEREDRRVELRAPKSRVPSPAPHEGRMNGQHNGRESLHRLPGSAFRVCFVVTLRPACHRAMIQSVGLSLRDFPALPRQASGPPGEKVNN